MQSSTNATSLLENDTLVFSVSSQFNTWEMIDRASGITWGNHPGDGGWVHFVDGDRKTPLLLDDVIEIEDGLRCQFVTSSGESGALELVFRLAGQALRVYRTAPDGYIPTVELFSSGLDLSADEAGEALLPIRMGLLVPAKGEKPFNLRLGTYDYEGLHMAMVGLFKAHSGLLITWQDPYTALRIARSMEGGCNLHASFELSKSARSLEIQCLGQADYHTAAAAYRVKADRAGYRVPWSEKLKDRPEARRLFGTCNFKLWTALARTVDENAVEKRVEVKWTFDEVAQIAEHLKRDVELDDVLFHLGGWTRYGYDCRHPDIMPANPECGGNEGLAECSRRVKALGYLFCLHDNYQDMYRDAPSWGEEWIQKGADGALDLGGVWLGGRAYLTCSHKAYQLAKRPQNLELVRDVVHPDLYFIDTTYAAGAQECFDPDHPLTKQEDIHWKQKLSDYSREVFGLFGSECGREWAVPHADFFEGLTSVSGAYYHMLKPEELDARIVPVFEMVFHDCVSIYGKYGYEPAEMAEQVIHHAAIGRTLYYHSVGAHLYWKEPGAVAELPVPEGDADPALYTRGHQGWSEGMCTWDRFMKNTQEILGPLNKRTSQATLERYEFLDEERRVRRTTFSNGVTVVVNGGKTDTVVETQLFNNVILPAFGLVVEAGDFAACVAREFNETFYSEPVCFTFTSLDGKPLSQTSKVKVFHGFGETLVNWHGKSYEVHRESVIES
jgi:hypothetical protein